MAKVDIIEVSRLEVSGEDDINWGQYGRLLLAQGDSWFSWGALPPTLTGNILSGIRTLGLDKATLIVQAARPGKLLSRMLDTSADPHFLAALNGFLERKWNGILFSGGGNDLIDAVRAEPSAPADQRLLQTRGTPSAKPADYVSEAGWDQLEIHLKSYLARLVAERAKSKQNKTTPVLLHTYANIQPRHVGTAGLGPWFEPALVKFGVPTALYFPLSQLLMGRIAGLLSDFAANTPNVVVVDSMMLANLTPADANAQPGTDLASNDFLNEIHPTREGYVKLARVWQPALNKL